MMQVWIDNLDGLGSVDHTASVQLNKGALIVRQLNKPTICTLSLIVDPGAISVPVPFARVLVLDDLEPVINFSRESGSVWQA